MLKAVTCSRQLYGEGCDMVKAVACSRPSARLKALRSGQGRPCGSRLSAQVKAVRSGQGRPLGSRPSARVKAVRSGQGRPSIRVKAIRSGQGLAPDLVLSSIGDSRIYSCTLYIFLNQKECTGKVLVQIIGALSLVPASRQTVDWICTVQ